MGPRRDGCTSKGLALKANAIGFDPRESLDFSGLSKPTLFSKERKKGRSVVYSLVSPAINGDNQTNKLKKLSAFTYKGLACYFAQSAEDHKCLLKSALDFKFAIKN